jgi:acetate kinase
MSDAMRSGNMSTRPAAFLVLNCGSSSVKFALFDAGQRPARFWSGSVDRIGVTNTRLHIVDSQGRTIVEQADPISDHETALAQVLQIIEQHPTGCSLAAAGHRVVHGGATYGSPVIVTTAVEAQLRELNPLAPLHQPHNLAGIAAIRKVRPDIPQVACFDTAFHHNLPRLATLTALPRQLHDQGVRRYGFHGLSYEYIVEALRGDKVDVERERIIIAHLGNGASMCALKGGRSVETTMGFSTLAGLPMGTRCGDLDPGIVLFLLSEKRMTVEGVQHLLYEQSGLLGMSGLSANMQDLLARQSERAAAEAIEVFCYQARRHVAALTASIGGLDRLVFTGGIGANAPAIRAKICAGLQYLGLKLDTVHNASNDRIISAEESRLAVEAFATDEELMIAHHVRQLLAAAQPFAAQGV